LSKITTKMKRHVRHVLKEEKPTIHVGKEGFTPQSAAEIDKQLERNRQVKVKILKSALQTETAKAIATRAAEQTSAALVEVRGHVFILYRKRKKQTI
jgi:RNA-binding protein